MSYCPVCKKTSMVEKDKLYSCPNCNFIIGKIILKKVITPDIVNELCNNGRTKVLKGFISKNNKPFEAALVLKGNKVTFEFPNQKSEEPQSKNTRIRVFSGSPGIVSINITGLTQYSATVNFGLVSSRMAECLGVIAAVKYLKHNNLTGDIYISANNREFVEYTLREITPRQKEMQYAIKHLWQTLEPFTWNINYERQQKTKLYGGTVGKAFPQKLFPWLNLEKVAISNEIHVALPDCPAVQAQIIASIRTSKRMENILILPNTAKSVLEAWEKAVS